MLPANWEWREGDTFTMYGARRVVGKDAHGDLRVYNEDRTVRHLRVFHYDPFVIDNVRHASDAAVQQLAGGDYWIALPQYAWGMRDDIAGVLRHMDTRFANSQTLMVLKNGNKIWTYRLRPDRTEELVKKANDGTLTKDEMKELAALINEKKS